MSLVTMFLISGGVIGMMDPLHSWTSHTIKAARLRSQGYRKDPIARPIHRIFIGDAERLNEEFMKVHNITHVVNCAFPEDCPISLPANRYRCIGAIDSPTEDFTKWYPLFKDTMNTFLQDPTCKNVYVHCQCGINRSVVLTLAYLIKVFRMPYMKLISHVASQRPCVLTNSVFVKQLIDFAKKAD